MFVAAVVSWWWWRAVSWTSQEFAHSSVKKCNCSQHSDMIYILLRIPCWNGPVLESRSSKEIIVRGRPLTLARSEPISCFRLVFWQWLWDTLYIRVTFPYYLLFQTHTSLLNVKWNFPMSPSVRRSVDIFGWLVGLSVIISLKGREVPFPMLYYIIIMSKKYNVQYV